VDLIVSALAFVLATLALIYNRPVATYFVENNASPFTFLHPQDRIPREDRPEKLEEHRTARDFWLPFMRAFVVLVAAAVAFGSTANLIASVL
jgi:hypothetical protein